MVREVEMHGDLTDHAFHTMEVNTENCLPCHTVGFGDPTGYVDDGSTPHLAGVQCENCHGSGADHVNLATAENITIDKTAELCGGCHTDSHHPTIDEWTESPHANTHEDAHGIPSCFVCHAPLGEQEGVLLDVECVACHDSHKQTGNDATPDPLGERDSQLLWPEVANPVPSKDTVVRLTQSSGVWQLASANTRVYAIFRTEGVLSRSREAIASRRNATRGHRDS